MGVIRKFTSQIRQLLLCKIWVMGAGVEHKPLEVISPKIIKFEENDLSSINWIPTTRTDSLSNVLENNFFHQCFQGTKITQ